MVYHEVKLDNSTYRTFEPQSILDEDLVWHRDKSDRRVSVIAGSNWQFQFDDRLPVNLNMGDNFIIKAMVYHRLIKTDDSTQLIIKIDEG